jgi:hypothetical protein
LRGIALIIIVSVSAYNSRNLQEKKIPVTCMAAHCLTAKVPVVHYPEYLPMPTPHKDFLCHLYEHATIYTVKVQNDLKKIDEWDRSWRSMPTS